MTVASLSRASSMISANAATGLPVATVPTYTRLAVPSKPRPGNASYKDEFCPRARACRVGGKPLNRAVSVRRPRRHAAEVTAALHLSSGCQCQHIYYQVLSIGRHHGAFLFLSEPGSLGTRSYKGLPDRGQECLLPSLQSFQVCRTPEQTKPAIAVHSKRGGASADLLSVGSFAGHKQHCAT